uniref:A-kinase anchor protein 2 C-terminal domain-containing protein n=1 Tax=Neogobius melanostomus TaxID=47308 RepID=A0A8C6T9L5_9GOBI
MKETPIEREIRRAIEREHSLRRSRGLPNPPTSVEYVQIPLKTAILHQPLPPTKSEKCQGKDRQFAGKKMQQDIHEEVQREQDLVSWAKSQGEPFFKLRSSTSVVKVEQDIREAQERERELHKQRINLYGTRVEKGGGRPAKTEEHSGTLSSLKALPVQDLPDSSQTGVTTTTTTTTG